MLLQEWNPGSQAGAVLCGSQIGMVAMLHHENVCHSLLPPGGIHSLRLGGSIV